jgi:hypothetical protein
VARYDLAIGIDQHWRVESEGLDATRNLADLPRAMPARIFGIWLQFGDQPVCYRDPPPAGS